MSTASQVLITLRQIIRAAEMHDKSLSKDIGLTLPQLMAMQTLEDEGALTVGTLAKEMNLTQATVTSLVDRLVAKGLVDRRKSTEDKRRVVVAPTPKGLELIDTAPKTLQDTFTARFELLKEWEQLQLLASLQRTAEMLNAHNIDAAPVFDIGALDRQHEYKKLEKNLD